MIKIIAFNHTLLIALISLYLGIEYISAYLSDNEPCCILPTYSNRLSFITLLYTALFLLGHFTYFALQRPQGSLWYTIYKDILTTYLTARRLLKGGLILLLLPLFMATFTSFKSMFPYISPYDWDQTLSTLDRSLQFGFYPHELLQPILGHPYITTTLNFFYNLWFFILYAFLFWQAFSLKDPFNRAQFFLSFVLCFSCLGTFFALLLSSAGPCYFGRITGLEDPYSPLMTYLKEANQISPVWSLDIQNYLWDSYQDETVKFGSGISAMPSMHVSVALLFALVAKAHSIRLYKACLVFLFLIILGSIHLGWHYAVDGYVSMLGTWGLWKMAGVMLRAWHGQLSKVMPVPQAYQQTP